METVSVAIAVQSGEAVSHLIDMVENHPLLEFCGAARSLPDLLRLLDRFKPMVLLISTSMMEDLEKTAHAGAERALSAPISFLLPCPDISWGEKDLARALRLPLHYCGFIDREGLSAESLYRQIIGKVDLFSPHISSRNAPTRGNGHDHPSTGIIIIAGTKGGVGGTLVSCSFAATLARAGRRVLLMDMDSDLSQLLHLKPKGEGKTALDLYPMAEEISWDLVRISIHRHKAGFYILPYGLRTDDRGVEPGSVPEAFLRNLSFLFDVLVVDMPRPLGKNCFSLLHHSPILLLVTLPDTLSANCARFTAMALRRCGLDLRRFYLVINRHGSNHVLRPQELARAVGVELLACLPDDLRSGMDFAELGTVPPADSPLGRLTAEMAASLGFKVGPLPKPVGLRRLVQLRRQTFPYSLSGEPS
jgi:MinD-like ATPase involved in chromosome partitioning or flagellar assembly